MPLLSRRRQKSWRKLLPSLREELRHAEGALGSYNIPDTRLEVELLMMYTLGINRAELYVRLEETLSSEAAKEFRQLVQRRCNHEPTAYILKQRQFYGIDFYVDHRALIPRPETELLVEEAIKFTSQCISSPAPLLIADVGTGSGAIAISLAMNLPKTEIYAVDISVDALDIARRNCEQHQVTQRVHLLLGNMINLLPQKVNIIVANLPYVTDSDMDDLCPEIKNFEPRIALAAGIDGLDKIRQLLYEAKEKLLPDGLILLEMGQGQAEAVTSIARNHFPDARIDVMPDLAGIERVARILNH